MDLAHIVALACVQGLTEFLPVSSSAHLVLVPRLFAWPDQGLAFDVATHLGTLIAVIAHFAPDLKAMAWAAIGKGELETRIEQRSMIGYLLVGTLPTVAVGATLMTVLADGWRDPWTIAGTTIFFGVLLGLADFRYRPEATHRPLNVRRALVVGLAQSLALIPGTSRSGVTITAGLMLGMSRADSARFSFLLSIPVIVAAATFGISLVISQQAAIEWREFLLAVGFSAIAGFVCLRLFLRFIERVGLMPYVAYRLLLGTVIIIVLLSESAP